MYHNFPFYAGIETKITKIQKLIKNENQSKKDASPRRSRKDTELMGLTEDLYKQYQSLNAQYDNLIGKVVSNQRKDLMFSSDSDSEYFSSKEEQKVADTVKQESDTGDNREVTDLSQNIGNTNQVLKTEASVEATEIERKLTSLMEEMRSLSNDKTNLELQIESQANEVKQLSIQNTELQNHVMELESLLKEKQGVVSDLEMKLNNSEEQAKSNIVILMAQVNELVLETESLRTQKDEMEEKIKCDQNEASMQRDDLMEKLNVMQQKLDSIENHNKELEAQLERKAEEISQFLIQMENLKENLAEMKSTEHTMMEEKEGFLARLKEMEFKLETQSNQKSELQEELAEMRSTEQTMMEEKEGFLARLKNMELELETQINQRNELEEQLRDTNYEIKQLMNENKALQDRNHELKAAMIQRGEEISNFLKENDSDENGASIEIMALKAEVNDMRLALDNLQEHKTKLELQNERNQKEYAESLAKIETLNTKLTGQIADQEKTIKDQTSTIDRINAEQKQTIITSNKLMLNQRSTERKMEELAEKLRKKMEDNIRLLHQRIHVAEQLNNENKSSCKLTKIRYEEENKILGEKVSIYEEELRRLKEGAANVTANASEETHSPVVDLKGFEFDAALNGLDVVAAKVEEHRECVMSNVSKMLCEVQFAKDWIKKMNVEMKQLKENVDCLTTLLSEKEEQELLLRDKVWNLEATVSKEGGEKLNLTNAVSQLEKKVGKMEKNLKEKDEDLDSLGEKKREAIRQLCLVVEFHRDRCNYLMNLVTSMRVNKKT
ncbi:putative protein Networked (NET), actin-binding (NAB) [Medicago truncatula]|uniref:NAB domain-containing protein n=1 Tax=Medicago truncatula TaxID=3880 RepID=A0A396GQM4_MEDTR|nr:putative protein Networked (NET), actin-binding (NAB) [Medicago truncatula]